MQWKAGGGLRPRPGFVLSVMAESPGPHLSLGENLGAHSQGALLEDQNGIVLVFKLNDAIKHEIQ